MSCLIKKELCFSESFLKVKYIRNVSDYKIKEDCILINLDKGLLQLEDNSLARFESGVFRSIQVSEMKEVLLICPQIDVFSLEPYKYSETLMDKWDHVYDIFPYENLRNVKLWRSPKERIGNIEYNLWYAPKKTHCAIHNEHNFSEIHTQVY